MLGLTMDDKHKVFRENKKIVLIAEQEAKPTELFVKASPNAVEKVIKESHEIDEAKFKKSINRKNIERTAKKL